MTDMEMTGGLVQVWVPVTGADGATRLESRWETVEQATALRPTYAA